MQALSINSSQSRHSDIWIISAVSLLLAVGILTVYSATPFISRDDFGNPNAMAIKHVINVVVGVFVSLVVYFLDPNLLKKIALPLFFFILLALILVAIPGIGHVAGGARRWLVLGPIRFQPGELAKIATIIYMANYCSKNINLMQKFMVGAVQPLILVATVAGLLLLEPDFGTSVVILAVVFCQLILFSKLKHLLLIGLVAALPVVLLVVSSPYRMKRVKAFLDPFADPSGSGYQLIQSLIAIGSGGISGAGLGEGKQKLYYLPAAHTDLIFSVISEELGFVGAISVILLFVIIGVRGLMITRKHLNNPFFAALSLGAIMLIVLPAFLNVGVATGLLPTKGMVLPFVSYGGSAIISYLVTLAVLLKLSKIEAE